MAIYSNFDEEKCIILMSEMTEEAINEAYFGLSSELQTIINQLGKFRSKYTDRFKYSMYMDDMNIDPELLKFNRMMEDFFGFTTYSLIVDPGVVQNAFTYPIGARIDTNIRGNIIADKNGFKYNKSSGYVCCNYIYTGLIFNDEFTDKEIMAIIIHEVGHNFSGAIDNIVTLNDIIKKLLTIPSLLMIILINIIQLDLAGAGRSVATSTNFTTDMYVKFMKEARKDNDTFSILVKVSKAIKAINSDINHNIGAIVGPFKLLDPQFIEKLIVNKIKMMKNPLEIFMLIGGYQDERIADNFATMYGLGPDLTSAFKKMDDLESGIDTQRVIRNIPLIGHLHDLIMIPFMSLLSLLDPHPMKPARLRNQLMLMKKEIDKEKIDPKLKKELQANIDVIEKQIQDNYDSFKPYEGKAISKVFGTILYILVKGDIREIFFDPKRDMQEYDKAYEKALARGNNNKK